jgi:hypothetical protein
MQDLRSVATKIVTDQVVKDRDTKCETMGHAGSRGVPFKITLASHGYTVVAKDTPIRLSRHLDHEAQTYNHLKAVQGSIFRCSWARLSFEGRIGTRVSWI